MTVEVRDVALEHYSASAVLVRFPNGEKVWLPLSQIDQMPGSWSIPSSMAVRRGKQLLITDWIAKQKGFKVTPRELDIDPERVVPSSVEAGEHRAEVARRATAAGTDPEKPSVQAVKPEPLVNGKPFAVAALEQQVARLERDLRDVRGDLNIARAGINQAHLARNQAHSELRNVEVQRDKAVADLALAQDALRKANEHADKAEAYIAAQGRADKNLSQERFTLLELE